MDISETRSGQTAILAVAGRVDTLSAPALADKAVALCDGGIGGVLIDMQLVEYMTSAGFRALIAIRRRAEQSSIGMALCGLNEMIGDLFEVSGLRGSFRIYPDLASAVAAIGKPEPA